LAEEMGYELAQARVPETGVLVFTGIQEFVIIIIVLN
jgi:hypothetical protein